MSTPWLDIERRLLRALDYLGVSTADERSEVWVIREADLFDEDDEDELVLNVSELARALEFIE